MSVYIDTSALYAVLDHDDQYHTAAKASWRNLLQEDVPLISSNYVLIEASALIQRRLGQKALQVFLEDIVSVLQIQWVDESIHRAAVQMILRGRSRSLSLVDCTSFVVMRQLGLNMAFAYDKHFQLQGFRCLGREPQK